MKIRKSQLRRLIREELERIDDLEEDAPEGWEGTVKKITKRQLRRVIKEALSYGDAMSQVDQIMDAIRAAGEASFDQASALLDIVGDDGSFETDEAISAIHSIEDEGPDALDDAENYIRDALRAQGR